MKNFTDQFITTSKARRILGKQSENMTDQQLQSVIDLLYECAHIHYKNNFETFKQDFGLAS